METGSFRGTTILGVRKDGITAIAGDGQITFGNNVILKSTARKVRRLHEGRVVAGFAGAVADALTLFEKFEAKLDQYKGNLPRAAVELAKEWRSDRILRRLEALLVAGDREHLLILSGTGEVIEPDDGLAAVGSGGPFALAAARALAGHTAFGAGEIAREALRIAAGICVFTNDQIVVEET
ncbi:MAG: ATP-dependent protease subunit HslV [Firmicutes bacterium]|nr:ATP-dependent protease subunit HslV [Bacillota bacterium]